MKEIFYDLLGANKILFIEINSHTNMATIPHILQNISNIFFIANFAAVYLLICLYFYYKTKKASNSAEYFSPIYYELTKIGICYALFGITFATLKFSFNLPRPFCSLSTDEFITIADISLERCLSSFPSAHTGLSLLCAYFAWPHLNKISKFLSCAVVLSVAISRITLAMHYPSDIIYSVLATVIIIIAGNFLHRFLYKPIFIPIKNIIIRLIFKRP